MKAAALAILLAAGVAAADPIAIGPANLTLDDAWSGDGKVEHHRGGAVLTVTRADAPNTDAWKKKTRDAYLAAVEAGFAGTPGFVRVGGKRARLGKDEVPAIDLTFRRTIGGKTELVAVRVLLFRTLTVAAAAAGTDRDRATLEAAVRGLVPAK